MSGIEITFARYHLAQVLMAKSKLSFISESQPQANSLMVAQLHLQTL